MWEYIWYITDHLAFFIVCHVTCETSVTLLQLPQNLLRQLQVKGCAVLALFKIALANYEKNNNCVRWEGVSLLPIFVCFQICRIFCEGVARKPLIKAPTSIDFQVVASYSSQVTWQEASTTTFSCSLPSLVLAALGFMQLKLSVSLPRIKLLSANARATYALTLPHS